MCSYFNFKEFNNVKQREYDMSSERLKDEFDLNMFLVSHGYRTGFFCSLIFDHSQYQNLHAKKVGKCTYISNDETYRKNKSIIDSLRDDSTLSDKLSILLGYPCKLPSDKKIGYHFFIKFNDVYVPLFAFISDRKLNISPIRNLMARGINKFNKINGTSHTSHFTVHFIKQ